MIKITIEIKLNIVVSPFFTERSEVNVNINGSVSVKVRIRVGVRVKVSRGNVQNRPSYSLVRRPDVLD